MNRKLDEQIKNHMAEYKKNILKVKDCGVWKETGYCHILPEDEKYKNLITNIFPADELIKLIDKNQIHEGFSHLNSSQAMALNLIGPLLKVEELDLIIKLIQPPMDIGEIDYSKSKFEYEEDSSENTNFDFFICGENANIYFELKYSEGDFGRADDDERHNIKYEVIYENRLKEVAKNLSKEDFFKHYQIWRNVIYSPNGLAVFIFPKFREDLKRKLEEEIKKAKYPEKIKILYVEDIVEKCLEIPELKPHYEEFKKKYLDIF